LRGSGHSGPTSRPRRRCTTTPPGVCHLRSVTRVDGKRATRAFHGLSSMESAFRRHGTSHGPSHPETKGCTLCVSSPPRKCSSTCVAASTLQRAWRVPPLWTMRPRSPSFAAPRREALPEGSRCFPSFRSPRARTGLLPFAHPGQPPFTPPRVGALLRRAAPLQPPRVAPGPDEPSAYGGLERPFRWASIHRYDRSQRP